MAHVPHTQFSTDPVPPADRFDVWRDSVSVLFEVNQHKDLRTQPFEAQLEAFMLDQIMLVRTQSKEASYHRLAKGIRSDGIDMIMLQIFTKGDVEFRYNKSTPHFQAGDIVVFDLNREARLHNTSFENYSVLFPRELIDQFIPSASLWHGQALPRNSPMTNLLKSHILSLFEFGSEITTESCVDLQRALLNLTSSAFQASAQNLARAADIIAATQLQQIKKHIKYHLAEPTLSPETIARACGVSRAHLYRLAEPLNGIANYIRDQRLKRCWKELQSPVQGHLSITELGFKWGYNDAGTFTRNFKKTFGMLPKDARTLGKLNLHTLEFSDRNHDLDPNRNYESWVRSLAD